MIEGAGREYGEGNGGFGAGNSVSGKAKGSWTSAHRIG